MLGRGISDSLVSEIEQELMPGRFVPYSDMHEFARDLEHVAEKIRALVENGEAKGAVGLYELFLAGAYEKMDECDDSGASLSMFWTDLFCDWVQARQAAECSAAETVRQILRWQENDDYGLCYGIEKDVARALNRDGYRLYARHFQDTVDQGLASLPEPHPGAIFEYDNSIRLPALSLKDIYEARHDVKSYARLCERLGLSPKDCERLAEMEMAKKRWDRALMWVEKGLALEPIRDWHNEDSFALELKKPEILSKLGRRDESLALAWADFEEHASEYGYERLMQYVPESERKEWHERAIEVAGRGDLGGFMAICTETKEWSRLASRIHTTPHGEFEELGHYHLEPAAEGLAWQDMPAAAKLYRALGFHILSSKKSKYYDAAHSHFRHARDLYRKAGLEAEWESVVNAVRADHSRKYRFMPGFERLLAGEAESRPSFAEKARNRWSKQTGDGSPTQR